MIISFQTADGQHTPLSNFYPASVQLDGDPYPTVEHAFQAAKSLDPGYRKTVAQLATPGQAKRIGQHIELRPEWEAIKIGVMRDLLMQKFGFGFGLTQYLLNTGDHLLIEGNTWRDTYWGQCPVGNGQNWLGFLLMGVRAELRARAVSR